ncbi:DEKNAAC104541 [Brettanomyces naardenensis]|uniref:DEKNAAC104541 n=1 Tax=Brettanomyces naardenensis TaxID=13370 RepID=A0A448YR79_BRENA|nr:DEKNAAC104541 [Brettanomyces naardenensis]
MSSKMGNDSSDVKDSTFKRARRACVYCIKKKVKCSGERPDCRRCREIGRKCVYAPYQKRISILRSKHEAMKETIADLKRQVEELMQERPLTRVGDFAREPICSPPDQVTAVPNSIPLRSSFDSGSSDGIVSKLAELENHHIHSETGIKPSPLQSSSEMKDEIDTCGNKVHHLMRLLTLEDAFELIDRCHFFLNDLYFPYDVSLMKLKLKRSYRPVTHFSAFLQKENTYFKPLVLLTIALGKRYAGESSEISQSLLHYALLLVTPVINLRARSDNYLLISVYTMASFYFRSISLENDAVMYSNLALQFAAHIRLNNYDEGSVFEQETKSRIMWVCFGTNRTLSAKMGTPFILISNEIQRKLPKLISYDEDGTLMGGMAPSSERCPNEEEFRSYIELTCIAEEICKVVYNNNTSSTLTSDLGKIIQRLILWNSSLPENYRFDRTFNARDKKHKRLICSLHLNYCFCIHLTTIPIMYSLVERKKNFPDQQLDLNENLSELVTICVNAAEMTVNILMSCHKVGALAVFGVMDLDYIYSASLSFFMCGDVLGIQQVENKRLLDSCLFLFKQMAKSGNKSAISRGQRLQDLIDTYRKQDAVKDTQNLVIDSASNDETFLFSQEENDLVPDSAWLMDPSVADAFQGLADADLNIWEGGYKNLQQIDSYWDEFQRNIFGS